MQLTIAYFIYLLLVKEIRQIKKFSCIILISSTSLFKNKLLFLQCVPSEVLIANAIVAIVLLCLLSVGRICRVCCEWVSLWIM